MKTFQFRLERVLAWRRAQTRLAEVKLEALHAELAGIAAHVQELARERDAAGRELLASGSATGLELALLDSFRKAADAEAARLEIARADCRRRLDEQMQAVTERRRDVKLLERLKERRLDKWQLDYAREIERDAIEAHLMRWSNV